MTTLAPTRTRLFTAVCAVGLLFLVTGCLGFLGGEQPSADHSVSLHNEWHKTATIDITIVREATNETVHDETYQLDPGDSREVYNTRMASPDGIETFEIRWTFQNDTGRSGISTANCQQVELVIQGDGTVSELVAVC